ncbi:MAG: DUF1800 domain-containing protein [Ignavibacteria bacterium]|nr:DUF1800 domain-containing protein [Ignavibacteria bacterium]
MNRRSFFSMLTLDSHAREMAQTSGTMPERAALSTGLEPYTKPLTMADALHLLRRLSFAPTVQLATQLVGKSADEAVELLLGTGKELPTTTPPTWIDATDENPAGADPITRSGIENKWKGYFSGLIRWWAEIMRLESSPLTEKLTLFWSGHFTSEFTFDAAYLPPAILYRQNLLIRSSRLGNFQQFAKDITLNGAMVVYLGGILNTKKSPNENYARELMELFTCGIGNYSEGDVKEAARVLTGWKVGQFNDEVARNGMFETYFNAADHDTGSKQILGRSIIARDSDTNTEFLVKSQEIDKLIDIIFEIRADAVAQFISRKLYSYFVYSNPSATDNEMIMQMATLFKQSNFEIRPLVAALFKSAHFYDDANVGVQIKTPAEYVVGIARQLGKTFVSDAGNAMTSMEQTLIDPPNVAGWEGYRRWISTKTYPNRRSFAAAMLASMNDAEVVAMAKQFPDYTDADKLATALEMFFLPKAVSAARHKFYVEEVLLQKQPVYEWAAIMNDTPTAARNIKLLLTTFIKAPDFHLC